MRRHLVVLLTMLTIGIAASVSAQVVVSAALPSGPRPTADDVVARLMSFDRNYDGQVARAELPERMHDLLGRGDRDSNQALDINEVRRLAESPAPRVNAKDFQPGQYGFGDSVGLDSRLHIEGAIDDLRLAEQDRDTAMEIAHRFDAARQEKTKSDLLRIMGEILTSASLEDFKAALEKQSSAVAVSRFALPADPTRVTSGFTVRALTSMLRQRTRGMTLARVIDKYGLQPAEQQRAIAAIERYADAMSARLDDSDRLALLEQLQPVLDDQQRDDLRAALERRPIVKQGVANFVVPGQPVTFPAGAARIQNLVIRN